MAIVGRPVNFYYRINLNDRHHPLPFTEAKTPKSLLANARKPSAATGRLCGFCRFDVLSGGLLSVYYTAVVSLLSVAEEYGIL
jgi:hypothetical protein